MAAGRPTKYRESFIKDVDKYLAECVDEELQFHKTVGEKSDTYERHLKVRLPTVEGFALYLGVNKTSIYEWRKLYPKFSNALGKIELEQRQRLLDKGLSGDYNPTIAKLILSNNHGMTDKTDVTSKGEALPTPIYGGNSVN